MEIRRIFLLCVFHCLLVDGQVLDSLPHDFLLIVDRMSGTIYHTDISNNSYVTVPLYDVIDTNDIDYDPTADVIYACNTSHILSISSTGDKQTTVRAFGEYADIVGIAVDSTSRLLFYADRGNAVIGVISLDNKSHKTVIRNVEDPRDIVVDPINGSIYWSEKGVLELILEMSNYDGTNRKQLGQNRAKRLGLDEPATVLDLDFYDGDLYLCESEDDKTTIRRFNASAANDQLIYENEEEEYSCSITVDQSYVYFAFGSNVKRIGKDGTGETVIPSVDEDTYPAYIHVHTNRSRANNGCSSGRDGCSHFCFPLPRGSKTCSCPDFMTLLPDRHTCQSTSILLITTNDRPHIYAIDPSNGQDMTIALENLDEPHAISYDPVNGTIFWTDTKLRMLLSASVSGHSKRDIRYLKINSSPQGIAVDATSRLLFYTDKENGIIAALSLDGSSHKVVIRSKFDEPEAIVTNPINGTIFWTSFGNNGKIETANYDGTNRQELINTGHVEPSGLAIDITEAVLYWCIAGGIYKADLNGFNHHLIYKETKSSIYRIAFYQSYLYFTSSSRRYVMQIGIDERKPTPFAHATDGNIVDLHIFNGTLNIDGHGCSNARNSCSHFCFPRPGGLKMCACPDGMFLESDGLTCQTSVISLPTDYTMNAHLNRSPSSSEIDGSSVGLTVLHAAVGALACLLVISVLLNVYFLRMKKRMQTADHTSECYSELMTKEVEDGHSHALSEAINNDIQ